MIAALAAADSGDTIGLPGLTIALTSGITIPAGVITAGSKLRVTLNGYAKVAMDPKSTLVNLYVGGVSVAQELLEHARCMTEALAPFKLGGEQAFAASVAPPAPADASAGTPPPLQTAAPVPLSERVLKPAGAPAAMPAPSSAVEYF